MNLPADTLQFYSYVTIYTLHYNYLLLGGTLCHLLNARLTGHVVQIGSGLCAATPESLASMLAYASGTCQVC